jgi:large subunit ribosomal protein L24
MKNFSKSWISSTKPNKQRKYRFKAPLHIKGNFLHAHVSKDLREKYGIRALRLRTGDKVRIMRGQFKKQEGKVEEVDIKKSKVYISKIEHTKIDGTKARYPIEPSNVLLVELNTDDKKRMSKLKKEKTEKSEKAVDKNTDKPIEKKLAVKKTVTKNKSEKSL